MGIWLLFLGLGLLADGIEGTRWCRQKGACDLFLGVSAGFITSGLIMFVYSIIYI